MYDRRLKGRTLRFGHEGMLYLDSFVMYDHQTDSLWVHVTGEAFHGPLKGEKLRFIPSTVTTWEKWKEQHPQSLVLPGRRRETFMGTYDGMTQTRNLGLAIIVRFQPKLYPFDILVRSPLVHDTVHGSPVLVVYAHKERTATAWSRKLGDRILSFTWAEASDAFGNRLLRDQDTGSVWSWLTGEAVSGPLQGTRLPQLTYNPILNDRFKVFYPGAPIYTETN